MDPFAQLPHEVLREMFKHVPSLPDKFKLAAVNRKFRFNILKMLEEEPMPLTVNFRLETLNDCKIPLDRWPAAVEVLAERTSFCSVWIGGACPEGFMDTILSILDASGTLNTIEGFYSASGNSALLEQFLSRCEQLDALDLDFPLARLPKPNVPGIDLGTVLNGKALSFLGLVLNEYPLKQLSAALQLLAPNTLEKCLMGLDHPINLVQLMGEMPDAMWSALTSLQILIRDVNDGQPGLFGIVARMPLLEECTIKFYVETNVTITIHQFTDSVVSLFNNNQARANQLTMKYTDFRLMQTCGCAVIHLVRVLQQQHPQLQVQIDVNDHRELKLTLGNITLVWGLEGAYLCAVVCEECRSFYPSVIFCLVLHAEQTHTSGHLHGYQLDRCKAERVADDHHMFSSLSQENYQVLSSVLNEAEDLATITFEMEGHGQVLITVDCGPCFSRSCVACVEV